MNDMSSVDLGTLAVLNKSEIDQQIATAKQYPRRVSTFKQRATDLATLDEATAQECIFALPREGKVIEGPSVRMAEIVLHAWGNAKAGARVIEESDQFVTAQGIFHDLEANTVITYEVKRRIVNKHGQRFGVDMIAVTANAACSIALRNAIFRGVPRAIWAQVYESARHVVAGDVKTLANRRAEAIKAFMIYGIDEARILARLEVGSIDDIGVDQLVTLRALFTAIKTEEISPEGAFPPADQPAAATAKPSGPPKSMADIAAAASTVTERVDPETGEVTTTAQPAAEPTKRKRRTKAEMEAARAAERRSNNGGMDPGDHGDEIEGERVESDTGQDAQGSPPASASGPASGDSGQAAAAQPAPVQAKPPSDLKMRQAFEDGKTARKQGLGYRAVPGDYRADARGQEWQKGWQEMDRAIHAGGG